jgi:cation transport protein ChaC
MTTPPPHFLGPDRTPILTRELLLSGELEDTIRASHPDLHVLNAEERAQSLREILDNRPEHGNGVWVFGYGSLIWNPAMHISGRLLATVVGWHRSFCLATRAGRGDAITPGMLLGLERGGACVGAVLRVEEHHVEQELDILWRREMVANSYIPIWLDFTAADGSVTGRAITFTINPQGSNYACDIGDAELIRRLATSRGRLGTGADYLFNTRNGLREMGIKDALLERLGDAVAAQGGVI